MRITGSNEVPHPPASVWDALLDPRVLVGAIPGCSRLEETAAHTYDMTVTAGVAAVTGTYDGTCALADLVAHESLTMRLSGAGAPGTIDASVAVRFEDLGGVTRVCYEADAVVGGMVGGVGQRMLASVSKRMAGQFFGNVAAAIDAGPAVPSGPPGPAVEEQPGAGGGASDATGPRSFVAPAARSTDAGFLAGVAVGAGLVSLGVVLGAVLGRRR